MSSIHSTESTPPSPTLPPVANPNQFDATFDWIEERLMPIVPNLTYNLMCLRHFFKLAAAVSVACFIASVVFQFKFKHNRPSFIISFTIAESITVLVVLLLLNYPWIENRISFRKPCQLYLAIENRFWIRLPKVSGVYLGYLLVGGYAPVICSGCPAAFVIFYICMVKLYGGQVNQYKIIEDFSIAFIIPIVDQFNKQLLHEPPIEVNKIEEEVQPYIFGIVFLIPTLFGIVARMCPQLPCATIEEESTTDEEETTTTSTATEDETHIDMESAPISGPVVQTVSSNPVVVETELVEDGEVHLEQDKITLLFPVDTPPISVIATAKISGIPFIADSSRPIGSTPFFQFTSGLELHGTNVLLRYLGRVATLINLSGQNALESAQIDEWLDYSTTFSLGSGFEEACSYVDTYLSGRTFLVGNSFSLADITIWSALAGSGQRWESSRKSKKYPIAMRWFDLIAEEYKMPLTEVTSTYIGERGVGKAVVIPTATPTTTPTASTPTASEKTSLSFGSSTPQRDGAASVDDLVVAVEDVCCCCGTCSGSEHTVPLEGKVGGRPTFEADLPDAKVGEVCLCFSPEPSGYLHIEHSKAALLNQYFAQRYQGRLIIRFGDTNPAKESTEFVEHLLKDIKTLGIKYDAVTYTSDYFPQLLKMAEGLLLKGKAYIDDTPRERMQKERMDGIESECRKNSPEKNLELWKEMIAGSERGLQCCLRGKLDMQDPNNSLRDPVYYRCNPMPHHRVGSKYKIYPTYEFACPFVDSTEGITHALRSSEYHDHNAQYYRILEDMGLPKVQIYEFSRLNMVYTLLSNSNLLWFVQKGKVEGWDDPRFPTVQGIVRRGLKIESLIQFILEQEVSKNLNLVEWEKLWTINKKIIDPLCPRHTAVLEERRVVLTLIDGPEKPFVRIIPRHKKFEGAGKKATTYTKRIWLDYADASSVSVGEEITLMDWANAIIKEIGKDQDGFVTQITGVLNLEGSVKTTKLKLTWLPETDELVNLSLVELDYLITKKKLEEGEDFKDVLNPNTKKETLALGDSNMRNLKRGEILQLERKGYFRCDVPFFRPSKPVVLIAIPDGRQQASPK